MSDGDVKVDVTEIWPQERDFITRPDRLKYVRRLKNEEICVFCKSGKVKEEDYSPENLVVYKTKHSQVLLNKYPYNTGHLIVAPIAHGGSMFDLSEESYHDLMKTVRYAGEVLQKAYTIKGLNIGVNHGKVAGAGIPDHLHWHVIPRWYGDTNFFPVICETKVFAETLEQTWHKIVEVVREKN
jgi:ATP adenylyltransferase